MKKVLQLLAAVVLVSFTVRYQSSPFQHLSALKGTWAMQTKRGTFCEEWKSVNDTLLTGRSYRTSGSDTIIMERLQLSLRGADVYYTPTVATQNGGKPVPFKLIEAKNDQFIFSNPDHDFPQQIAYELVTKDSLHAWIGGKNNGKDMKRDFYYKRVQ
jgi:hypothetical protein